MRVTRVSGIGIARYVFVLPALLFILIFFVYPLADNVVVSVENVNLSTYLNGNAPFVGWSNYAFILQSPVFQQAARTTATFCFVSLFFQFMLGMLLALFFSRSFPLSRLARSLLLVPWLLPVVVTSTAFKWLFTDPNGLVNYVLVDVLHVMAHGRAWLADPQLALPVVILTNVWVGVPFNMIILHSGLQGISPELYEAADIDGAGRWARFWRITLPLLRPVIAVLLILGFVYTIKAFGLVYAETGGGPANDTEILSILSYQLSFGDFLFGRGAAVGNVMVLVALVGALAYIFALSREQSWA
jgi:multiple sugar transport system permease protein